MSSVDPRGNFTAVPPAQFGKYSLLGHLATGGMAEVWLARQVGIHGFEKIVVIKRARPELGDRDTTQLFLDEARLVGTLEHPNIAQVYEIGSVGGSYFFVMEYVDGADLRRLIETAIAKRHRVGLADVLYIMIHVCNALHYAHEKHDLEGRPLRIVHRDVSPSNVLISHDGAVKVCDFGVAKARNRRTETQDGVLKGKFSYMSPEQCQSKPIDRRSDVFSIGILLYELSTLSKLFRASNDFALLKLIAESPIPPPSSRVADYPPELEHIVMKALARAPEDRYPTAQALQLDLEAFAREHRLALSSIGITRLMSTLFERRSSDALIRAQRATADLLREEAPHLGSSTVRLFAAGSAPVIGVEAPGEAQPGSQSSPSRRSSSGLSASASVATPAPASRSTVAPAPVRTHWSPALWLVGAAIAGAIAGGATVVDHVIVGTGDRAVASALATDAERISSVFDAAARSAHMRADGIATTPMLRAAIETDAATLRDLATTEMVFTADRGEAFELFQFRGDQATSLLRLPRTAAALSPLRGRDTRIESNGSGATVIASAPIADYRGNVSGGVVVALPVDLAALRRAIGEHAVHASLKGLGKSPVNDIVLVPDLGEPGGPGVELAVPGIAEGTSSAILVAAPRLSAGLAWAWQIRWASGGLGALLLLGFVVSLFRRPG